MDNNHHQPRLPRFVLKMKKIKSCKVCFKGLKKWIEKISGVNSVAVKPEKKLVYVSGKIQPQKLINKIHSELDREATLCQQKSNSKDNNQQNEQHVDNNVKNKDRCTDTSNSTDSDDDDDGESSTHCCSDKPHYSRSGRDRRHKPEPYVEPPRNMVDEEICGDNLCLLHPRNSIFRNGHPYFMQPPVFGRGPMPPYSMRMPPPPPPYSMGMPPPPPPPPLPAYGGYGYPRSHLPAEFNHVSDFFNDENTRGCSIM